MNVRRALTFFFQDPQWARVLGIALLLNVPIVLLTALGFQIFSPTLPSELQVIVRSPLWSLLLLSIVNVPLYGYELRITRQVIQGHDLPLPAWSDLSGILRDGVLLWVVVTSWSLLSFLVEYVTGSQDPNSSSSVLVLISSLIGAVVTLFIQPAAQGRLAATGSLRAGLEPASVFGALAGHLGKYFRLALVTVILAGIGFAIGIALVLIAAYAAGHIRGTSAWRSIVELGILLPLLMVGPYFRFVSAHLIGQIASARTTGSVPGGDIARS